MTKRSSLNAARKKVKLLKIAERDGWFCWICDNELDPELPHDHDEGVTVDHYKPLSLGGDHSLENLRLAHRCCNEMRGAPEIEMLKL